MAKKPSFIAGVVRAADIGYLLRDDDPKCVLRWKDGKLEKLPIQFWANSCCMITLPEPALVTMNWEGRFNVLAPSLTVAGNLWERHRPALDEKRFGDCRRVVTVAGRAHAIVMDGGLFRLDSLTKWERVDEGLPRTFSVEAVDGWPDSNLVAAGSKGEIWRRVDGKWSKLKSPTTENLDAVRCLADGTSWVAGKKGTLLHVSEDGVEVSAAGSLKEDIWDLAWFRGELFASTMTNVYRLVDSALVPVDFGEDAPMTCHRLSTINDVLWSIGEREVMSFNGNVWSRVLGEGPKGGAKRKPDPKPRPKPSGKRPKARRG